MSEEKKIELSKEEEQEVEGSGNSQNSNQNTNIATAINDQDSTIIIILIIIIITGGTHGGTGLSQEEKSSLLSMVNELIDLQKLKQQTLMNALKFTGNSPKS